MEKALREERNSRILQAYNNGLSFNQIGEIEGMNPNSIRQILVKVGAHKSKPIRRPGEIKQLSPLLIARYLCGESTKSISKDLHLNEDYVCKTIKEAGLSGKQLEIKHQAMRCYKSQGHTMGDVAELFGVSKGTAQQVCKGISPQSSEGFSKDNPPPNKGVLKGDEDVSAFVNSRIKPTLEYFGNYTGCDGRADLRCKVCGEVFNRAMGSIRHGKVACPTCMAAEAKRRAQIKKAKVEERKAEAERLRIERERIKTEKEAERERIRIERIHPCPVCGTITDRPKYCSERCAKKVANAYGELRRRNLIKSAMVDKDITVDGLYIRDKGRCAICGGHCDWDDYTVRNGTKVCGDWYPSVDHIIPLAKGGLHSWDNVQLAHRRCNWEKSDEV